MAFSRWPFDERWPAELARAMAPLFGSPSFPFAPQRATGLFPAVNLYENGEGYLVRAEIPGVSKDDLDISVKADQLTIRGERKLHSAESSASYHRREREGGQFRRAVSLPRPVDPERIAASFKDGVLEVRLPLVPEAQPRKIHVN